MFTILLFALAFAYSATSQDLLADCSRGPDTPYDPACYEHLKINEWIVQWHNSMSQCPSDETKNCCVTGESWSVCFLRTVLGDADWNCTDINVGSCTLEGHHPLENSTDYGQKRYVVRNIYAVNDFFTNWYIATVSATGSAALTVPGIISTIDPSTKSSMLLHNILFGLTVGLAVLGTAAASLLDPAFAVAGGILISALEQTPAVADAIWPSGEGASDQIIQIGNLQGELGGLSSSISGRLGNGLATIMNNVTAFASFTAAPGAGAGGPFSGPNLISLPKSADALAVAFKTYVVSAAMRANSWIAYRGPIYSETSYFNSTPASQVRNFQCNMKANGVCDTVDSVGVFPLCQPGGWSEYTSSAGASSAPHSFYANQEHGRNDIQSGVLVNAIADNHWGSLDLLFEGGWNCTSSGGSPADGSDLSETPFSALTFNPNGGISGGASVNTACLSRLPVRSGCGNGDSLDLNSMLAWPQNCPWFFENTKGSKCGGMFGFIAWTNAHPDGH